MKIKFKANPTTIDCQSFHIYQEYDWDDQYDTEPESGLRYQLDHTNNTYFSIVNNNDIESIVEQCRSEIPLKYESLLHFTDEHYETVLELVRSQNYQFMDHYKTSMVFVARTQRFVFNNNQIGNMLFAHCFHEGLTAEEVFDEILEQDEELPYCLKEMDSLSLELYLMSYETVAQQSIKENEVEEWTKHELSEYLHRQHYKPFQTTVSEDGSCITDSYVIDEWEFHLVRGSNEWAATNTLGKLKFINDELQLINDGYMAMVICNRLFTFLNRIAREAYLCKLRASGMN